ncbi:MAG: murein biosynthesis integral membrane protein MurJ [Pseudomonadota bacterium]
MGSYTTLSRLLGFVRDLVFAHSFGANAFTDAFFVAFKIPNFLRRLFAEGAFSTAFVPVLTEYKSQRSLADLKSLIDYVAGTLALILLLVSALGMLLAPVIVGLFAVGWVLDDTAADKLVLAGDMLRLTFPYLFFISLTAFAGGVMQVHNRFAAPAFTPVLLNLSLIGCALWLSPWLEQPVVALAWGVLIAGVSQFVFQIPFLAQLKLLPRFRVSFRHPGVRRILRLMLPALFAVSITQINLLLDTVLASFLISGSISWLYYSDRLVEFPLGILGVAMSTVLLPRLARDQAEQAPTEFARNLDWGLRLIVLFGVPAAVGLALLAGPIIATLFLSDVFVAHDVQMARLSLMAYASGLLAFLLIKVLAAACYAQQDTRTPVRIGMIAMSVNMVFNLALIVPLQHTGLALATSLSAYLNAFLLWRSLRGVYQPVAGWGLFCVRIAVACGVMSLLLIWLAPPLSVWLEQTLWQRALSLLLWVPLGVLTYMAMLLLSGMRRRHVVISGSSDQHT